MMKKRKRLLIGVLAAGLAIWLAVNIAFPVVDPSFATKATLRFHEKGRSVDTIMTERDLRSLKKILRGRPFPDSPSCGFGMSVSITLTDGHRSITFCPACDKCSGFQIGETDRYLTVSDEQRDRFEEIVAKYGMTFPCE